MDHDVLTIEEAGELLLTNGNEIREHFREIIHYTKLPGIWVKVDYSYFNEDNLPQILVDAYLYCFEVEKEVIKKYGKEIFDEYNISKHNKTDFKNDPVRNINPYFMKMLEELTNPP